MDTRYFSRFYKFHHEFNNIIFGVKRGSRYSMMNIALGAVQECGTHLQWVQRDIYPTRHFSVHSKIPLVGEDIIAITVDKAKTVWRRRKVRECG